MGSIPKILHYVYANTPKSKGNLKLKAVLIPSILYKGHSGGLRIKLLLDLLQGYFERKTFDEVVVVEPSVASFSIF